MNTNTTLKKDLYAHVTDSIIATMEGDAPAALPGLKPAMAYPLITRPAPRTKASTLPCYGGDHEFEVT